MKPSAHIAPGFDMSRSRWRTAIPKAAVWSVRSATGSCSSAATASQVIARSEAGEAARGCAVVHARDLRADSVARASCATWSRFCGAEWFARTVRAAERGAIRREQPRHAVDGEGRRRRRPPVNRGTWSTAFPSKRSPRPGTIVMSKRITRRAAIGTTLAAGFAGTHMSKADRNPPGIPSSSAPACSAPGPPGTCASPDNACCCWTPSAPRTRAPRPAANRGSRAARTARTRSTRAWPSIRWRNGSGCRT